MDWIIGEGPKDDDHELYEPEETVRGRRAKRKAEKLAARAVAPAKTKAKTKATTAMREKNEDFDASGAGKKKLRDRVPAVVERAFYEAGSVILRQLVALVGDPVESIRQSKRLLEMDLVSADAFAEVFGGRADFQRMKRGDLYRLAQAAGIKGLSSVSLEKMRVDAGIRVLAHLSIENYRLWRDAEERELLASFESGMLPGEPVWLEQAINENMGVFQAYRKTLEENLRLPRDITSSMKYEEGALEIHTSWRRSFFQTVYCYRGSVAMHAAVLWREFKRMPALDMEKIVSKRDDLRSSLDAEKRVLEEILGRADYLRGEWKKVGADLDAELSGGRFRETRPVSFLYLAKGPAGYASKSVLATRTRVTYNIPDEEQALALVPRLERFAELEGALKKAKLEVPPELDPFSDSEHTSRVRKDLSMCWEFIESRVGLCLKDAVDAHMAWLQFRDRPDVVTEKDALALSRKLDRLEQVQQAWREHNLEDVDRLDVNMSDEIATKYPTTKRYVDGKFSGAAKDLESALKARLEMREKNLDAEPMSLIRIESLPRLPRQNHVYVCPCGYYAGQTKMKLHLKKNEQRDPPRHATGY